MALADARGAVAIREANPATGWQRVAAYVVDYLVIAAYAAFLAGVISAYAASSETDFDHKGSPTVGQLVAFVSLTLPVMLYFAVSEASRWRGTPGKRVLKLRVTAHSDGSRLSFWRTLLRAAIKFAPWELAHTVLWRVEGWPFNAPQPTTVHWLGFAISMLWAGWYVVSLYVGSRRTLYDRVAGSVVVRHT